MTEKEAIYILRNAAWLGSDADRQKVEEAVEVVANAIEAFNNSEIPNGSDCIDRAEAQIAIQFAARRYTVAHEAHGEGHVVWSDNLISVTDAMNALRGVPSAQPSNGACLGCKHLPRYSRETPCVNCSNNYVNRWERNDKTDS